LASTLNKFSKAKDFWGIKIVVINKKLRGSNIFILFFI